VIDKGGNKVLIMAGGTGGHIFPGLAVADQLVAEGWEVCWLGTSERMEARLVPEHGYKIRFIDVAGVRGNGLVRLLMAPWMIIRSIFQAISVIRQEKPAVVLGFGGFASGPGGIAAWLMRKPVVLHEQNAVAGFTNSVLAHFAKKVLMAFPDTFNSRHEAIFVGNPIRSEISELANDEISPISDDKPINVLILGGSLGAKALNENVPTLLAGTNACNNVHVWHQTGRGNKNTVESRYVETMKQNHNVRVDEFIVDMTQAYFWADIVICRSGALTVAEVAAAGIAAIFVPFPFAVDDHQTLNAAWLADKDAAIIMPQERLVQGEFIKQVSALLQDKARLHQMAINARAVAITDATQQVASYCKELAVTNTAITENEA
jgi:UDP-N-acetylglucosamine--N-acetylmuramyl-(pentapeptide) pyrophosphoryl-undecaprenol N-acetylglucosamine transferase